MTTPAVSANRLETRELWDDWSSMMLGMAKSFTLKAVLELGILDMFAKAGGQLTLHEIESKLPSKTVQLDYLGRIMTYASLNNLFTEISDPNNVMVEERQRRFDLTPLSKMLVEENPDGTENVMSLAPITRVILSRNMIDPWLNLSEAVLTGTEPFELAHKKSMWELGTADSEWGRMVNNGMAGSSFRIIDQVMKVYDGFKGIKHMVDVGGGIGASLTTIIRAYPHIQGINFDLPQVISRAPEITGVKHVGGNMFTDSLPEGDAVFMKHILHDWGDEACIQVLKSCYKALPQYGKVILVEEVLADPKKAGDYARDLAMLACTSGKERNAPQWHYVLKAAGFERLCVIAGPTLCVIEGYKSKI